MVALTKRMNDDRGSSDVRGEDRDAAEGIRLPEGLPRERVTAMEGSGHAKREGVAFARGWQICVAVALLRGKGVEELYWGRVWLACESQGREAWPWG